MVKRLQILLKKSAEREATGFLMALQEPGTGIQLFLCSFLPPFSICPRLAELDLTLSNTSSGTSSRQGLWLPEEPR
jgi:hypothetical protein